MKKSKRVQGHQFIGDHNKDWLNIVACIIVILYSALNLILKKMCVIDWVLYLAPFVLFLMLSLLIDNKILATGLYLVVGLLAVTLDTNPNGIQGLMYIFFAYNELKSKKISFVLAILSFMALTGRFLILNTHGLEAIVTILVFIFIFATFYLKIIKDNSRLSKQPEEIKAILKLYCNGYTYEKISITLGLGVTPGTVRRKITAFMNKNDIKNDAQLGKWLHRNA